MKKHLLCLYIILFTLTVFAIDYRPYLENVPGLERFPQASALNVFSKVDLKVEGDRSYSREVFYVKKILTYKGKKRYSDISIAYNADYESVELLQCVTIDKDGKELQVPEEGYHDSELSATLMSPTYINYREKIVNLPSVEPGCFVVMHYRITNNRKQFISGVEHLRESNPYLRKEFSIQAPKFIPFYTSVPNPHANMLYEKSYVDKVVKYQWSITDVEEISEEVSTPSYLIAGCPVAYSSEKNWTMMGKVLFDKMKKGMIDSDEVTALAKEIAGDADTDIAKLKKLYFYFATDYQIKASYLSSQEFAPKKFSDIIEWKYGSRLDLCTLFIAMAKAVNVECFPAIILDSGEYFSPVQTKIPMRGFFDHMVVYYQGRIFSLGEDTMPFDYAGVNRANLLVGFDKPEIIPYKIADTWQVYRVSYYDLEGTNARIHNELTFELSDDMGFRRKLRHITPQKRKIAFAQMIEDKSMQITNGPIFNGMEELDQQLQLKMDAFLPDFLTWQNDYLYCKMPGGSIPIRFGRDQRSNPFYLNGSFSSFDQLFIRNLPENLEIIKPSESLERSFSLGDFSCEETMEIIRIDDDQIRIDRKLNIPSALIPAKDYLKVKRFITSLQNPMNRILFFKKKGE